MRTQLFFIIFLLIGISCPAQELIGSDHTLPGTLASFEIAPAQEASWHIVAPAPEAETYQVDSGSAKLYFSSPKHGRYTVIAGIVVDGKPKLLTKVFINGEEDAVPFPVPLPPISSLETWIKTQAPILVKSKDFDKETRLVADCFEQIVRRIDADNIRSPQNARGQLQIALTVALGQASPAAVTDWLPFLTELSRRLEQELGEKIDDLAEVKKVLHNVGNALKSLEPRTARASLQNIDGLRTRGSQNRIFRNLL